MKLWLVRHAQPLVDAGVCYGATEVAADAAATAAAAAALALRLPAGLQVACSPRRRCLQLAEALHTLRPDLQARVDPRLAELDFGSWEGRRWDDIGQAEVERWSADFASHRCGGGESVAQLFERVGAAWAEARGGSRDALWITHAGVVRTALLLARGCPPPTDAGAWPRAGLAFGAALCLELQPVAASG